jgi:hypothetical protein
VSCVGVDINKQLTLSEVKADYAELNNRLPEDTRVTVIPNSLQKKNKPEYVAALIKARRKLIAQDGVWAEARKAEKAGDGELILASESYDVRRDELLDGNFHKSANGCAE